MNREFLQKLLNLIMKLSNTKTKQAIIVSITGLLIFLKKRKEKKENF